jgi:glutamyl-tRNA synthetase
MAEFVTAQEIGFGKIGMPLRLSLVGALQGPDVPVIMAILGKRKRLHVSTKRLKF